MESKMELRSKTAVISGGASGMGAGAAKWLAEQGMRVAILDRDGDSVQKLAQEISCLGLEADVVDSESVKAAVDKVVSAMGEIHVCINCAGVAPAARIVGKNGPMALDDFQKVIQINLVGTFNVMR
jgi:NAD(P)-dependent dehydrogenase (short-subunit alcohol dehydrogenase family)